MFSNHLTLIVLSLMFVSCSSDKGLEDSTSEESGSDSTTSNDDSDSAIETSPPALANLIIHIEVDVEGIYAESEEGEWAPLGGPYLKGLIGDFDVEPGTWQITSYDVEKSACDVSDVVELSAGERFDWIVLGFPGTFDKKNDCIIP